MKRGGGWERALEVRHAQYRAELPVEAVVFRTHPGVKVVRGRAIWETKGPPDYTGIACGKPVLFDAKECRAKSKRWKVSIAPHQARDLEAFWIAGGTSFIALRIHGVGDFVLPWANIREDFWEGNFNYIGGQEAVAYGAKMPEPAHWLPVIRELFSAHRVG